MANLGLCYAPPYSEAYEASRILTGQGYRNVEILDGGIVAWPHGTEKGG